MRKTASVPLALIVTILSILPACTQMTGPGQQGHMMNMPFGGLFMILVLVAIVVFIALVLKGVTRGDRSAENPLEIIKRRYANGDINQEEFEQMKKELADDEPLP